MNILQLFGRLGSDPETRFTSNGTKVTTFRMAVSSKKGGQEETMWWRVTLWGDRFDKMTSYLKKGSAVIVSGAMQKPEMYQSKDGQTQVSLEIWADSINFSPFGGKSEQQEESQKMSSQREPQMSYGAKTSYGGADSFNDTEFEDEPIPF
jgi:single-strand DNA-binding protein